MNASANENKTSNYWTYLKHASDLHSSRINFFLIAESMLFIAFFSFSIDENLENIIFKILIILLGFIFSLGWFLANLRLSLRIKKFDSILRKKDDIYNEYIEAVKGVPSDIIMTYILPLSTLFFWLIFLIFTLIFYVNKVIL